MPASRTLDRPYEVWICWKHADNTFSRFHYLESFKDPEVAKRYIQDRGRLFKAAKYELRKIKSPHDLDYRDMSLEEFESEGLAFANGVLVQNGGAPDSEWVTFEQIG